MFGLLHIGNANATWFSSAAIALEAGILLGALYMLTRRLWAVIGFHAAWNFMQGWVFDIPVSGNKTPALVRADISGSDWMTGGAFGLEASVPAHGVQVFLLDAAVSDPALKAALDTAMAGARRAQ